MCTRHFVGFVVRRLISYELPIKSIISANATKVLSSYYGSPDRPYKIEVYRTQILGMNAYLTVNPDPKDVNVCMPIGEVLYGQIGSCEFHLLLMDKLKLISSSISKVIRFENLDINGHVSWTQTCT